MRSVIVESKRVTSAKFVFPSFTLFQNSSTLRPTGVIAPIPVITTLLILFSLFILAPDQPFFSIIKVKIGHDLHQRKIDKLIDLI